MTVETKRFGLGDVVVQTIADLPVMEIPLSLLMPSVDPASFAPYLAWMEPDHFSAATAMLRFACHGFVIRHGEKITLIDTCIGCGKPRPLRPDWNRRTDDGFLGRLRAVGIAPEQVDTVLCTHLHADHVGWNTVLADGRWVPTFPNARYLISRTELAHWQARADALGADQVNHGAYADSVLPVVAAGQVDLIDDGFDIAPGLVLRGLAGHTPGQVGLHVTRGETRALFCGDALHSPIQIIHPDWSTAVCTDPIAAAKTRYAVLAEAAETGTLLVPAHLRGNPYLRVTKGPDGFRPVFGA